jgi:hypothetical protein
MQPQNLSRKMRRSQLVALLAPTLGQEKSEDVISGAAKRLRITIGDEVTLAQAAAILDDLAQSGGIVGVVARFVKARSELGDVDALVPSSVPPSPTGTRLLTPGGGVPAVRSYAAIVTREELIALLSPVLGDEKSAEAIAAYAPKVGATGAEFTRAQAEGMLELMSAADGTLGVVASFARARFILKFLG